MKNKFKSFSISLMIVFLLVTISCQVEETIVETENIKNQNDLLIKKISFNEIKNSAVVDKINNTKKLSKKTITTSSKIIKDTLNNFYINSDEGMYIEKTDGTKSYTFSVFRENATDLENLVIIVYPNNQIKTFLVDYNKTFNELNSMSLEQMQNNQIEYYEINFNTNEFIPVFQNNSNGRYICETIMFWDTIPCYEGDLVGAGQGIDCWGWVIIGHTCWEGGSGGGEGFGFDSDFGTNGNGSPTGGGGSTGSGSSGSSSNQIITTPTTSLESEQEAQALIKRQKNFTANLSWNQNAWLNNNQEAENNIYEYLESQVTDTLATEYSTESVQFVNELIDLANDYLNSFGNTTENQNFISEIIIDILNPENDDVEPENVDVDPNCESFNFQQTGSNWQESAVLNIHFQVTVISPQGIYVNHLCEFPQAILFGCPINLSVGNTNLSPGLAASTSAQALEQAMDETVKKFGNKPVSGMIVDMYFKQRLKHNYPLYIPGGRVNFNSNNFTVTPTQYRTSFFGNGNCN